MKLLCEAGADVEAKTSDDVFGGTDTPLMMCLLPFHQANAVVIPMLKLLAAHGADVNAIDASGSTLMMNILSNSSITGGSMPASHLHIIKTLLDLGARTDMLCTDPRAAAGSGLSVQPVLYTAIESSQVELVRLFIKHGKASASLQWPWPSMDHVQVPLYFLVDQHTKGGQTQVQIAQILIEDGHADVNYAEKKREPLFPFGRRRKQSQEGGA
jgi:hypothetical protein